MATEDEAGSPSGVSSTEPISQDHTKRSADHESADHGNQDVLPSDGHYTFILTAIELLLGIGLWQLSGIFAQHGYVLTSDVLVGLSFCSVIVYLGMIAQKQYHGL